MLVSMATFEHLPIRVGGLAEAVTSLCEAMLKYTDMMVLMPSHGLLQKDKEDDFAHYPLKYCEFHIRVGEGSYPVTVYTTERNGVRIFLFSNEILDHPSVYQPREIFMHKMIHFSKAVPGFLNVFLKKEMVKPDIIHINDWHCVFSGALVKKYFKIPFVFTIHRLCNERISVHDLNEVNLSELVDKNFLEGDLLNIEKFGAHRCDHLTTVSYTYLNEQWKNFFSTFGGKTTYVWNGADHTFWNPADLYHAHLSRDKRRALLLQDNGLTDGVLFFNVGRLDAEQKGIDMLLNAFKLIMQDDVSGAEQIRDQIRFILIGSGDPNLEHEARQLQELYPQHIKVIIDYLGRETTREFYGAADFCVIPSNFEPFGLVQLEAMCMGCIPIGTRVGGINDTVIDLHDNKDVSTGRLVPSGNPVSLADAIVEMASMAVGKGDKLENMRSRGRDHVIKNFNWDKSAQRYLLAYQNKATIKLPFVSYADPY